MTVTCASDTDDFTPTGSPVADEQARPPSRREKCRTGPAVCCSTADVMTSAAAARERMICASRRHAGPGRQRTASSTLREAARGNTDTGWPSLAVIGGW